MNKKITWVQNNFMAKKIGVQRYIRSKNMLNDANKFWVEKIERVRRPNSDRHTDSRINEYSSTLGPSWQLRLG